jgi:hypothetical protein
MSKPFDKTNTWTLNRNDKGDNPKRPDFRGTVNIEGVEYSLSGWTREGQNGKFISGPVEPKKDATKQPAKTATGDDDDSDLPF